MKKRKNSEIDPNLQPFPSLPNSQTKDSDPKTSEFAFFKKLKKDASVGFRSRPLQKDSGQPSNKPNELRDSCTEKTGDVKVGSKGDNSSRILEHISTVRKDSFFSPSVAAWNKSGFYSISSTPKPSQQDYSDNFKPQQIFPHEGNKPVHGEVFARKRQKLRQCVADALSTDIEKLCSKGRDIIPMLLSRLFPMSTEENKYEDTNQGKVVNAMCQKYEDTNPGKVVNATRYDLPDSRESYDQFKEHYHIPKRKLLELESSQYFSDHVLSPTFLRSDVRSTPNTEFPTYHSHNFQSLYSITEPECKLSATPSFNATANTDVTLGSLFNKAANATRYGLHDFRELDVKFTEHSWIPMRKLLELESSSSFSDHSLSRGFLQSVDIITPHANFSTYTHKFQPLSSITESKSDFGGTLSFTDKGDVTQGFLSNEQKHEIFTFNHFKELGKLEREPVPLLMEKDFDCNADETSLPITCKYIKPYMAQESSILHHSEENILHNTLDEYHFRPPSSLLDKPQDFNSILDSGSLTYQEFKFGKYVCEDMMGTNLNHTTLSLSHNKQYFNVSENCKNDTSYDQDSVLLSPYQHWVGRTISSPYHHHPNPETWVPSSLDECQWSLPLTTSHLNYPSSSSRSLQLPQRESMSSLFHINDNYEPELDGKNHGEMLYHFSEGLIEIYNSSFLHMSMQRNNGCPFPLDGNDYANEQEQTQKLLL